MESQLGQGPRQRVHPTGETSDCGFGAPLIIPGRKPTRKAQLRFSFYNAVCLLCEPWDFLDLGAWPGLQGLKRFQDLLPFFPKALPDLLCLQAGTESCSVHAGQKQVRGLVSCFWSLNKTTSLLISLTEPWRWYPKWKMTVPKGLILYDLIFVACLEWGNLLETETRLVVPWGWEMGWRWAANEYRFPLGVMKMEELEINC